MVLGNRFWFYLKNQKVGWFLASQSFGDLLFDKQKFKKGGSCFFTKSMSSCDGEQSPGSWHRACSGSGPRRRYPNKVVQNGVTFYKNCFEKI